MNETPFTTHGDEALEARIVAWVLGEASAFEAAELGRLCEERPELMVFKRRIAALHGMLSDAENNVLDWAWKLPPEKREAVEHILGKQDVAEFEIARNKRVKHSGRRALLAIAACLVLTIVIAGLMAPAGIQKARKKADLPAARSGELQVLMAEQDRAGSLHEEFKKVQSSPFTQSLRTDLPAELIEGTPMPMNVPNLEVPKDGPAGSATWFSSRAAAEGVSKSGTGSVAVGGQVQTPGTVPLEDDMTLADAVDRAGGATPFGTQKRVRVVRDGKSQTYDLAQNEARQLKLQPGDRVELPQKGAFEVSEPALAKPESSSNGAIVANSISPLAIQVPDVELPDSSLAFGDTDFGAGWGGQDAQHFYAPQASGGFAGGGIQPGRAALDESGLLAKQESRESSDAGIKVGREFNYPTEFEPPPPAAPAPAAFPATPATPPAFAANTQPEGKVANLPAVRGMLTDEDGSAIRYELNSESNALGLRSGDSEVSRDNIASIVNNGSDAAAKVDTETNGRVPTLEDAPLTGRLFRAKEKAAAVERPLPEIATRPTPARESIDAAEAARKSGRYEEARKLLSESLAADPGNAELKQELEKLDDPLRTNPALAHEHQQSVDQVRRGLYMAEGNFNLGKFDDAKREYEEVLLKAPTNQAVRRGMERIETAKSDYYRAAYDHSRSELLTQVDSAWELEIPEEGKDFEGFFNHGAPIAKAGAAIPDDAEALAKAIRDQEDKVEERRKVLGTIARTKGIIYKGEDSFYKQSGLDEDLGARSALQAYQDLEMQKAVLEGNINSLLNYNGDQLMIYASGPDMPDNAVRTLYPQYLEAKRQLEADRVKGKGEKHPDVQVKTDQIEKLKHQLDESVVNLRETMQAQLDLANKRLKDVEALKKETREEAIKRGLDAQDYADAMREFEQDQALLQQMKLKLKGAKAEAPKPDLTKLMEEIPAAEEPYSTFSLNISDASFRIAQAALAKGEQPDPAGIKVEQFYNAVDYGDPAPASNEPVACAIEQAAHPVIPGRNLVRVALKTAAVGRSAAQPLRLTLLVDQSGSMARDDRRAAMDKALGGLAGLLTENDRVSVIAFSRTPRLVADGMTGVQSKKLADMVNQEASEGGTNLEEAIKLADQLALRHKQDGAQNRIVLFTDGAANLGDADPERLAEKVKELRQKGIAFDIAGIAADDLNDALLGELARNGNGRYYVVGKNDDDNFAKQLAGAFHPAAENVKVQVRFNPERVASYKLIGFEKDRLKTEDFRNDKVDAAELAAEEAGVAIYQVEPLPEGRGEIGEVSVRFRDTAAGEMVERSWTIPHDPAAPALDRAAPSMQLATLAMLAAEKLKGGPLGQAVDFNQLAAAQAEVKAHYSGNARIAELLRMLEMLK